MPKPHITHFTVVNEFVYNEVVHLRDGHYSVMFWLRQKSQ